MSYSPRQHAQSAAALIDACGGLDEAASACRLGKPSLSKAQRPNHDYFLPVDVIGALEDYCGDPVYSRSLAQSVSVSCGIDDVQTQSAALSYEVAGFNNDLIKSLNDAVLSPRERDELARSIHAIKTDIARLHNSIKSHNKPGPNHA